MVKRYAVFGIAIALVALHASPKEVIVPISAVAAGANNTLFRTDARIFNPSPTEPLVLTAEFLRANQSNPTGITRTITVPPGEMLVLNNIAGDFFGSSGLGAIRFESAGEFRVTSRTYTDSPNAAAPGTFGQFIPAVEMSGAMTSGVLLHLSNDTNLAQGFRGNAGFMNPGSDPVSVSVIVRSAEGAELGRGTIGPIPARSVTQVSIGASIGNNISFSDGYMTFSAPSPVIGFASVVDNRSSDQIFILAQPGGTADEEEQPPAAKEVIVDVGPGNSFNPRNVTINKGDTVTWRFLSPLGHTTTSDTLGSDPYDPYASSLENWDSGVKTSGTFSHRFTMEGDQPYHCAIHSFPGAIFMNGVVTVRNVTARGTAVLSATGKDASSQGPIPKESDRHAHHGRRGPQR